MNLSNMGAYGLQINLKLLNDIIVFVVTTAKANHTQIAELRKRCIFPLSSGSSASEALQRDYGFMYLGELLERYEERFGMSLPDPRAIALALGYTRDIATPEMFVGSQRADFIQGVRRCAEDDLYLTGALCLIHGGESGAAAIEQRLKGWAYTQTEELIFAMSLFPDAEQALSQFSGQLVDLLGKGRTMPLFGNTDILNRALVMLFPLKKRMKARHMDLLRALLSLPVSFVREGSNHYTWLTDHGYTSIEIAYANIAALCSQCVPGGPGRNSLTAEKLAVSLFRTVLAHDQPLPAEVYQQLTQIYQMYAKFDIKCYEEHRLADTLKGGLRIQTPETMAWFIRCTDEPLHPATASFDVMESKWDTLAGSLDTKHYLKLFESCLTEDMDAAQIRERLDRYQVLTQKDFLERYSEDTFAGRFPLMVKTGIIDLWTAFQGCLSEDGGITNSTLLRHIGGCCHNIQTLQAVEFLTRFLPQYGFHGIKTYFGRYRDGFEDELWAQKGYNGSEITLKLQRDFLADDSNRQRLLLHWVDEYFFTKQPKRCLDFVIALLKDEGAAALLTPEYQRGLFDAVIAQSKLSVWDANELKQRYLTPEEQQADQAAKEAAEAEKKRQEHLNMIQSIEACYADSNNGTFGAVLKYLDKYRYYNDREAIAHRVVRDGLEPLLIGTGYALAPAEAERFLIVCRELFRTGALAWAELQSYILKVKEVEPDDPDEDPGE